MIGGATYPLIPGEPFDITQVAPEGVSRFTILGLDPSSPFLPGITVMSGEGVLIRISAEAIPEPATLTLLALGGLGLLVRRRSKR
jgi:hypothetical protein